MDPYGGTNPAEFFAVASEAFFEKAKQLKRDYPQLYVQLKKLLRTRPYCLEGSLSYRWYGSPLLMV